MQAVTDVAIIADFHPEPSGHDLLQARFFPDAGAAHRVSRLLWTTPTPCWELALKERPGEEPGVDFIIDVGPCWKTKEAALRAHRSQLKNTARLFFDPPDTERRLSLEAFRSAPGYEHEGSHAQDLWSDIG